MKTEKRVAEVGEKIIGSYSGCLYEVIKVTISGVRAHGVVDVTPVIIGHDDYVVVVDDGNESMDKLAKGYAGVPITSNGAITIPNLSEQDTITPDHYHSGGIDVFAYIEANLSKEAVIGYHQASVIKYTSRAGKKGSSLQDFMKAEVHSKKLLELSK